MPPPGASSAHVGQALAIADGAVRDCRRLTADARAAFLDRIADEISGASNFPLAFSVAGVDTASVAAAGRIQDGNPRGIWRLVDGDMTKNAL